jgi:CPA1 family monovalent cation:H+ antiporter
VPGRKVERHDTVGLSKGAAAVVAWCGMRGTVTLAAALALPTGGADGPAFPYRDLVLFTAFSVVLGTLVVQGMTLRPLMNALELENDDAVEREVRLARVETLRAALSAMVAQPGEELSGLLRHRYEVMLRRAEAELAGGGRAPDGGTASDGRAVDVDGAIARRATSAERRRLLALREDGTIGDAAFQRIEQELDLEELNLEQLSPSGDS